MNYVLKIVFFFCLLLVINNLKAVEKYSPNQKQTVVKVGHVEADDEVKKSNTTINNGNSTKNIDLDASKYIKHEGQLVELEVKDHLIFSSPPTRITKSREFNYKTSTSHKDEEKATTHFVRRTEEFYLNSNQSGEPGMLHHDTLSNDENVTSSRDNLLIEDSYFNQTEEKISYKQNSVDEVINDTVDTDDVFDWRDREDSYNKTSPEMNPYSVLLLMVKGGTHRSICSGSIITREWVLTAAHCVQGFKKALVYAGGHSKEELDLWKDHLPKTAQLLRSRKLIAHPQYEELVGSDIALVKVDGKFNMTKAVNVVKLATTPWKKSYHGYASCELTAFGIVQRGETHEDDYHRKTTHLQVKNPCLCSFKLQIIYGRKAASTYLCTKPKLDYGPCPGDSGGGLVCGGKLRGVTMQIMKLDNTKYCELSFSPGDIQCGDINTISVFLDVCPYLPWINNYTKIFKPSEISNQCKLSGSLRSSYSLYLLLYSILIVLINTCFG